MMQWSHGVFASCALLPGQNSTGRLIESVRDPKKHVRTPRISLDVHGLLCHVVLPSLVVAGGLDEGWGAG